MRYQMFKDLGKHAPTPKGYKHIRLHWVLDVREDGWHPARLVAGGHLTDVLKESAYSGEVRLRSLRMCILLAEMNDLKINATDISSAHLEAMTNEKLTAPAGPEFGRETERQTRRGQAPALIALHKNFPAGS